jgi:hypothetical protein
MLEMLSRLVGRIGNAKVEALNRELAGRKLPDAATLLVESRLTYVQQGLARQLPKPSPRETLMLLGTLSEQVSRTLNAKAEHPIMADPMTLPSTSEPWDNVLWKIHVLENQLDTARFMADTMTRLAKGFPSGVAIKLNDGDRKLIQTDHAELVAQLQRATLDVEEREIELRIARLRAALERLENPTLDSERFLAAYTSELDSRIITDFFDRVKKGERAIRSETLSATETIESMGTQIKRARELAKDLSFKAALFYEGIQWWLRGRYGMGPDASGLAKSPEALHSLSAQFGLYMPAETPRPSDPTDQRVRQAVPTFERRHHYWWAWEDRRLHRGTMSSSTRFKEEEKFSVILSRFW